MTPKIGMILIVCRLLGFTDTDSRTMVDDLNIKIGKRLRSLREARGYSQEEFAELCGLHRTYVGGIERGERNVTLKTLEKIAKALGVAPEKLLTKEA